MKYQLKLSYDMNILFNNRYIVLVLLCAAPDGLVILLHCFELHYYLGKDYIATAYVRNPSPCIPLMSMEIAVVVLDKFISDPETSELFA